MASLTNFASAAPTVTNHASRPVDAVAPTTNTLGEQIDSLPDKTAAQLFRTELDNITLVWFIHSDLLDKDEIDLLSKPNELKLAEHISHPLHIPSESEICFRIAKLMNTRRIHAQEACLEKLAALKGKIQGSSQSDSKS